MNSNQKAKEDKEKELYVSQWEAFKTQKHYDNTNGSLYKFAQDHGLNAWEMDIVKRVVRCRKKGNWLEDLQKTQFLIDLYISEFKDQ